MVERIVRGVIVRGVIVPCELGDRSERTSPYSESKIDWIQQTMDRVCRVFHRLLQTPPTDFAFPTAEVGLYERNLANYLLVRSLTPC